MAIPNHYIDERERNLIYKLQNLAIERYGSIRKLASVCGMNRKIMDRIQARGIYALTSFSVLKLCFALKITPNQFYGFEALPEPEQREVKVEKSVNLHTQTYRQVHERLNAQLFQELRR